MDKSKKRAIIVRRDHGRAQRLELLLPNHPMLSGRIIQGINARIIEHQRSGVSGARGAYTTSAETIFRLIIDPIAPYAARQSAAQSQAIYRLLPHIAEALFPDDDISHDVIDIMRERGVLL